MAPRLQRRHQARLVTEHREHQQLGVRPLLRQPVQQLLAPAVRQPQVHKEHVGIARQGMLARMHQAAREPDQAPWRTRHQRLLDKLQDRGIVFDQVDARVIDHGGRFSRRLQNGHA